MPKSFDQIHAGNSGQQIEVVPKISPEQEYSFDILQEPDAVAETLEGILYVIN